MAPLPPAFPCCWRCCVMSGSVPAGRPASGNSVTKASFAYLRLSDLTLGMGKQRSSDFFVDSEQGPKAAGSPIQLTFLGCR